MMNVNFMGKLPSANKAATVLKTDAEKFFPNSTPIANSAKETIKGLTEAEIEALGIMNADVVVEYEVGETIVVTSGAWKDTVGMIKDVNAQKQSLTINVELFGRETPVELSFSEVKRM